MTSNDKYCLIFIGVIISVIVIVFSFIDTSKKYEHCAYCDEILFTEGTQIYDAWLCNRCWSNFELMTQQLYGNMWCQERMKDIYNNATRGRITKERER